MANNEDQNQQAFSLNASPSHLLHRAQQAASIKSSNGLKAAGITLRQFSVLAAAAETEGASQSRLVDATGIDRSTLADMVQRMEEGGLIERMRSETDARAKSVILTAKGRMAMDAAAPAVRDADDALLSALPKSRRDTFLQALSRLTGTDGPAGAVASTPTPRMKKDAETGNRTKKSKKKVRAKAKKANKPKASQKSAKGKKAKSKG